VVAASDDNGGGGLAAVETIVDSSKPYSGRRRCEYFLRYFHAIYSEREDRRTQTVRLPERPAGLCVVGTNVYVISSTSVGLVDFAANEPGYERVFKREDAEEINTDFRGYRRLIRKGNVLAAVGEQRTNRVIITFIDTFHIDERIGGHPVSWRLPSAYIDSVLVGRAAEDGSDLKLILLTVHEGNPSLIRVPLHDRLGRTSAKSDERYEVIVRDTELCLDWCAMAIVERRNELLLVAAKRGLFSIPLDRPVSGLDDEGVVQLVSASENTQQGDVSWALDCQLLDDTPWLLVRGNMLIRVERGESPGNRSPAGTQSFHLPAGNFIALL